MFGAVRQRVMSRKTGAACGERLSLNNPLSQGITIALDGPAGSGKSTTAREVAKQLDYVFVDSGSMYRAVTLKVLQQGLDPQDEARVADVARGIRIELRPHPERTWIFVDGEDVSGAIRTEAIAKAIGPVARNPLVRAELVRQQQEMGRAGGVVMDGRDIGTVVFPDAQLKVFMTASDEERARRRVSEYEKAGGAVPPFEEVLADIRQRDHNDRTRDVGPLLQASDAVLLETDGMTIDQQIERVVAMARERETKRLKQ